MSCGGQTTRILKTAGRKVGLAAGTGPSRYVALALGSGLLTGALVYARQKRAETRLNSQLAAILARVRPGAAPAGPMTTRAGREAALVGGATALAVGGGAWLAQRSAAPRLEPAPSSRPVTWLPERPVGAETDAASQVDPNRQLTVRYRGVDLSEPVTSHTLTGALNPAYDQTWQPRRRDRVAARAQVDRIANRLEPRALLKPEATWAEGPPLVGPDGLVERSTLAVGH